MNAKTTLRQLFTRARGLVRAERRGVALGVALGALVVIGALIAGAFLVTLQHYRLATNTSTQVVALSAAEYGLDSIASNWDKNWNSATNGSTWFRTVTPGGGAVDTVRITRLNSQSFLLVSEARVGSGVRSSARRRTSLLMRLNLPTLNVLGAITSGGNVLIGGSTALNGRDTSFTGWGCPAAGPATSGVTVRAITNLSYSGTCAGGTCIQGSPLYDTTSAAGDTNTYFSYGGLKWDDLVAMADKRPTGTLTGVNPVTTTVSGVFTCNFSSILNWGDPTRATPAGVCEKYFPIIYAPGDLTINGVKGQGMLLVQGNLNIQGGFTFYGAVITRGTVKLTGTGNHVYGAVMAAQVVDSTSTSMLSGNSSIQYSRCALNTALRQSSYPKKAAQRGWQELY